MAFDAQIEDAIVAALEATQIFDGIYTTRKPMADDQAAEDTKAVSIIPLDGNEIDEFDDTSGYLTVDERTKLVFIVRAQDPAARDLALRQMFSTAQNALNGAAMASTGLIVPAFTRFKTWRWEDPQSSESRITAIFQYRYLVPGWTNWDTTST